MSLQEYEKCLLPICFALFIGNNALKSFRRTKGVACLVHYSRKLFLIKLPLLFKKWLGKFHPSSFVDGIRTFYGIALTITKLIDFYLLTVLTYCSYCCRLQISGISASFRRIWIICVDSCSLAGNITSWVELKWMVLPPIV